jgi:hypothetical protein
LVVESQECAKGGKAEEEVKRKKVEIRNPPSHQAYGVTGGRGRRKMSEVGIQGVNPMRGFGDDGGKAGGSIISITRCKIVTITAS